MISTAIVLAAGEGSRLRSASASKPLCVAGGAPLIDRALSGLAEAGIGRAIVVTGYRADDVEAYLANGEWPLAVQTVRTPDWRQLNGVSARAAAPLVNGKPTLLLMCDHMVEPALYRRLAEQGAGAGLRLGIDRRLGHPWVDPDDVTFVKTEGDAITAIGKGMADHDAYDTGVFAVAAPLFDALAALSSPSITDAVRLLAANGQAGTVDCSDLEWLDVDDPRALALAADWGRTLPERLIVGK